MGVFSGPDLSESGLVLALDPANKKSYSQNEFQFSTDIFAWCGSTGHNNATISRGTTTSPVGTTPMQMIVAGTDPHIGTYNTGIWNIAPSPGTQRWIVSVYAKASTNTTGEIVMFGANSSGTSFVGGNWLAIAGQLINITTEWQRFSAIIDFNNASIANIHVRLDGPQTGGTGQTIWWDGLQVERVPSGTTTPTPFTSSYYGGSVFRDLVGSNNGTLTNYPTYNGANGGSLSFDGVDDYVTSFPTQISTTGSRTVSCFFRTNITSRNGLCGTRDANPAGWVLTVNRTSAGNLTYFHTGGSEIQVAAGISTNTWYNACVTYDAITATAILYLNGVRIGSPSTSFSAMTTSSFNGVIGAENQAFENKFNGNIAQVQIYNRALTPSEIQQNFNATRGRYGI